MADKKVLSIGQCDYDHGQLSRFFRDRFQADVVRADDLTSALAQAGPFALVLVNRVLDADGGSGLEVIRTLKSQLGWQACPTMLVSNFPEAHTQAIALGALPGFGKAALQQPETAAQLAPIFTTEACR